MNLVGQRNATIHRGRQQATAQRVYALSSVYRKVAAVLRGTPTPKRFTQHKHADQSPRRRIAGVGAAVNRDLAIGRNDNQVIIGPAACVNGPRVNRHDRPAQTEDRPKVKECRSATNREDRQVGQLHAFLLHKEQAILEQASVNDVGGRQSRDGRG